jgi:hypothetical protein
MLRKTWLFEDVIAELIDNCRNVVAESGIGAVHFAPTS